jgi:hypothetical protein
MPHRRRKEQDMNINVDRVSRERGLANERPGNLNEAARDLPLDQEAASSFHKMDVTLMGADH